LEKVFQFRLSNASGVAVGVGIIKGVETIELGLASGEIITGSNGVLLICAG
jgi:hypothetical protein